MWNNDLTGHLEATWRKDSFYRMIVALGLSLLIHLLLVGKLYLSLPNNKDSVPQVIEARLVPPQISVKTEVKAESPSEPVKQKQIKRAKVKNIKPIQQPEVIAAKSTENQVENETLIPTRSNEEVSEVTPTENAANSPTQTELPVADNQQNIEEVSDTQSENLTEDTGLIINQNTYQYVETTFDIYTDKEPVLGSSSPVGEAKINYQQQAESKQYHIKSLIQPKGLAALVIPDLLQISEGDIGKAGLIPKHYLYKFGDKKNKIFNADFDWQAKQLRLQSANGEQTEELTKGTQDLLSFMYQFMFIQPLQTMELSITNGKKLGVYQYGFEGEETVKTKIGELKTIHLLRASADNEKKTELWLAIDYQYVPVKIRETDKDGKVYELLVSNLKTEP